MQRRLVVTGIAAAFTGAAIQAAASEPRETEAQTFGEAERAYVARTRAVGALSLALSRLAGKRGDDDDVKEFVQFEIAEQETLADVLRTIERGAPVSGHVAAPSDADVMALLDAKAKETLQRLDGRKTGTPFDQDFIRLQIEGHERLMELQIEYLAVGRNASVLTVAKLARAVIKEHQTLLGDIDAALGRG